MILKINGNIKPYYVQTLAMIFFPGVKFPENEDETDDTLVLSLDMTEDGGAVRSRAVIKQGGRTAEGEGEAFIDAVGEREKAEKFSAGEAVMKAGESFTSFTPPWGILTGVRPAKVASEMYATGKSESEAALALSRDYFLTPEKASLTAKVATAEKRLITDRSRRECSVYIGIPFCPTRCAYCSFVSYTSPGLLKLIPEYLTSLGHDIDGMFSVIRETGLRVASVYIGGGTPTILDAPQLSFLLGKVREHITGEEEFTLEAGRPDTITADKLKVAKEFGVNRMSVNPQTLNDEVLRAIGRAHTTEMFYKAYETARNSGIENINVDLIAGLQHDSRESFGNSVDGIIALDPENITVHTFSVKRSSEFKTEGKFDPYSKMAAECVEYSLETLTRSGYMPYYMYRQKNTVGNLENIGYSKPGHEGLYNIYMMEEVHSVFAAGASSVTRLVSLPERENADGGVRIERLFHPKYPYEYLRECGEGGCRTEELRKTVHEFFGL